MTLRPEQRLGAVFPQTELGADPVVLRDYAQAAEALGYTHIAPFDHVLGGDPAVHTDFRMLYTFEEMFHEPFCLFGYLAACTTTLEFATGIMILPQRDTYLTAKQAAQVDVLSNGRMRLGVAVGWNPVEYEGLGRDWKTRGRMIEEQIVLMRRLWTEELVDFTGDFHEIHDAGINPLPVQRPIPVWLGGMAEPVIKRVGALADGWFPRFPSLNQRGHAEVMPRRYDEPKEIVARMHGYAREAGRDPSDIAIEGRVFVPNRTPEKWKAEWDAWKSIGATHMQVYCSEEGLDADGHIAALRDFAEEAGGW